MCSRDRHVKASHSRPHPAQLNTTLGSGFKSWGHSGVSGAQIYTASSCLLSGRLHRKQFDWHTVRLVTCLRARFTSHPQGESPVGVCRGHIDSERLFSMFLRIPLHTNAGPNSGTGFSQWCFIIKPAERTRSAPRQQGGAEKIFLPHVPQGSRWILSLLGVLQKNCSAFFSCLVYLSKTGGDVERVCRWPVIMSHFSYITNHVQHLPDLLTQHIHIKCARLKQSGCRPGPQLMFSSL